MKGDEILEQARQAFLDRMETRDEGDVRSMARCVESFNQMTGHELSEMDGWIFMIFLKLSRSRQGEHHVDDYIDGAGYFALAGECVERLRGMQGDVSGGPGLSPLATSGLPEASIHWPGDSCLDMQRLRDEEQGEET